MSLKQRWELFAQQTIQDLFIDFSSHSPKTLKFIYFSVFTLGIGKGKDLLGKVVVKKEKAHKSLSVYIDDISFEGNDLTDF